LERLSLAVRRVLPGGVCNFRVSEALGTWRHLSPARQSGSLMRMASRVLRQAIPWSNCGCLLWCAWSTRLLWYLKGRLVGIPWVVARNVSFELWLEIGVKHVTFLELWLRMTSLELWLGMVDEHKELFSWARVGECCWCECAGCGQYRWV